MTEQITFEIVQAKLAHHTGTVNYYRHPMNRRVTYTDGAKDFAETVGAYWLLDIVATELDRAAVEHGIIFITADANDGRALLSAVRDVGEEPFWTQPIAITSLPDGKWSLWMAPGGPEETTTIFLPSEY